MLRNRTEDEENLLRGVNIATNPTKLKLGYFTSLQNWIPAKKYKIKKKRGPATLVGTGATVVTTPNTCGTTALFSAEFECDHDCPLGQFAQATYVFDEDDHSNSGPAIRIKSDSTSTLFYGLAAVYKRDPVSKIVLGFWDYQTLSTVPTTLASFNTTLNNGDVVKLEADSTNPSTYLVKVNGGTVITYNDAGPTIDVHAPCVGFVVVETVA